MPHLKCRKCHHEWDVSKRVCREGHPVCDWCGVDRPRVLESETPLERMLKDMNGTATVSSTVRIDRYLGG